MNEEEHVYRITPKGFIAMNIMKYFGIGMAEASDLAQRIEDDIFLAGYVYIHHSRIRPIDPDGEALE